MKRRIVLWATIGLLVGCVCVRKHTRCRKLRTSGLRLGTGPGKIAVTITEEVSEWRVARQR